MKNPAHSFGRAFALALASVGILTGLSPAQAATLTWDPTQTPATPAGGAGTWDTSGLFWSNGVSDVAWTNSILNDTARFAGTAGLVTVGEPVSALGLEFASGYALTGSSAITLGTGGITTEVSSGLVRVLNTGGVTLGANQLWSVGSGSALSVSGPVNNGGFLLTTAGIGNASLLGVISGTGGLTHNGTGTLTLSGVNTFSGGLTISGGTVSISSNTALGGTSGTAGAVTLDGGTLRWTGGAVTNTHVMTIGSNGGTIHIVTPSSGTPTYIMGNAGNLTGSGTLTVTGDGTLGIAGSGNSVLVFGQANTGYTGNVVLQNGGIIEYANANGVGTGSTFTINDNGMLSANGVNIARDITLNSGGYLAFQNNNNGVFSGNITLGGDAFIRMQNWWNGTVISGTITNTISGAHSLTVNSGTNTGTGGTLTLGGFDAKASSADLVLDGASLAINSNSGTGAASVARANSLTINTGNLTVSGVASQDTNDVFGTLNLGNGSAGNLQGYSTWTLSPNAATNTKLTFDNMGTRTAGSWVALVNGATLGATPGAGTANIYFTNGLSSTDLIGGGGATNSSTASIIPWLRVKAAGDNNVNAQFYGYDPVLGVVAVSGQVAFAAAGATDNATGTGTLSADKTINSLIAGGTVNTAGHTLTVTSGAIIADTNLTFDNGILNFGSAEAQLSSRNARALTINSGISGSGGLTYVGFRVNSDPALILNGANTYTGVTNFYGYGGNSNIRLTNSLALQNSTLNHVAGRGYALTFGNGGTSGQTAYTFGGLSGNANLNLNNNNTTVEAVALTIGGNNESTTYSGILSSTVAGGSLIKTGTGTLTLGGVNTFDGATTVNDGTLALASTGSLASTAYTIADGAIFDASAKSSYSLAAVATTFDVGATTAGFFNGPSGELTFGDTLTLNFLTASLVNGQTYNLFDFGSQTGDFSFVTLTGSLIGAMELTSTDTWTGSDSLNTYNFTFNEESGIFSVSAVPEPSTYAAIVGTLALVSAALRRRRMV